MDKYLRNLQAMMLVADKSVTLCVTGNGDVLEPEDGIMAIGSGGNYALSAARALADTDQSAEQIARKAMQIAGEICIYTNGNIVLESLDEAWISGLDLLFAMTSHFNALDYTQPHWQEWWGDVETEIRYIDDMIQGRDTTRPFIFQFDGKDLGYIQVWKPEDPAL